MKKKKASFRFVSRFCIISRKEIECMASPVMQKQGMPKMRELNKLYEPLAVLVD